MELHAIEYEGIPIEYQLIRKDVKYINLRVNKHGQVVVSAAKRVPFSVIEEFVQSKALWIINHLAEVEKIRMTQPSGAMYDGKTLYYLGEPYTLHIAHGLRQIQRSDNIIYMSTFQTDSVGLRSEYLDWLREQAAETFSKLLDEIYPKVKDYGIPYPKMHVRNMRSIWGSCTVENESIRLNLQLMKADPDCIRQVIYHELAHFRYADHSRRFYALLTEWMPNWKECKERLENMYKDGV